MWIGTPSTVTPSSRTFNAIVERSFGDDDDDEKAGEGSGEPREEVKVPESTLEPDLQTFCKLIFNLE